jgi:hypothetical protein
MPIGTAIKSIGPSAEREVTGQTIKPPDRDLGVRGKPPQDIDTLTPDQENEFFRDKRPGFQAALTDVELRARLLVPRKQLTISLFNAGDPPKRVNFLYSPKPGYTCDVTGGPKPISLDIVEVQGEGVTFGVHYQIETTLQPVPDGSDQVILSHRWIMTHDPDENNYVTRTIQGEIIFDLGLLASLKLTADWFRNQFIHPIPLGFKRNGPTVTLSPDGSTIRYEVKDVDTPVIFDAGDSGATNIEIIETMKYSQPWRIGG